MPYFDAAHQTAIAAFNSDWDGLSTIEKLAKTYEIDDIAQDNRLFDTSCI